LNPLYRDVLADYGAVALPCRIKDPDRKGKVESGVGHAQKTPLKGQRFESLEAAQSYLDRWEERWADTRIHGTTKRQVAAMFAEEKPSLLPLPLEPFRYYQYSERTVHLDGCVARAGRRSHGAYRTATCTSTREHSPAGRSRSVSKHSQHQPQRRGVSWNVKPIPTGQHQLDRARSQHHRLRLHQRELDPLPGPQPLPPGIESRFTQALLATELADRLTTVFLLCNPLAPQLTPFHLFGTHLSTIRRRDQLGQWCSCDAHA
jgi:hypothetical protein